MHIIEAPDGHPANCDIFLAGGISGCPDWQSEVIELLNDEQGVMLNPRRSGGFIDDIADEQIAWEYHALRSVDTVFFWFPKETLCPIALLELGAFTQRPETRLIVGTHPEYARRFDVIKQLELSRPEVVVHDNIEGMVSNYLRNINQEPQSSSDTGFVVESTDTPETGEEERYNKARQIAQDELSFVIDKGTLGELLKNIEDNYPSIDKWLIREALNDMLQVDFSLVSDGRMTYVKSIGTV